MKRLLILMVVVMLAWTGVLPVQAHAMLVRSIPDANASLGSSPAQVELFLSEAVASSLSKIRVVDSTGKQVDAGDTQVDPADAAHMRVSLPPLSSGIYMVIWNVISATDGHQTTGSFPFAVGKVDANALAAASAQMAAPPPPAPVGDMLMKGLLYLAAVTLMGGILFTFLVWNPSLRKAQVPAEDLPEYVQISRGLALAALVILTLLDGLGLLQAGRGGGSALGWPWQPQFFSVLFSTRVGILSLVRFGLAMILAGILLPRPNRWNRWLGLAVCLGLLLTFSLESHAAGGPHPLLPVLADWIHLAGVSVWVGGLFSFLGGMWLIRKLSSQVRTQLTAVLIPHFTTLAMLSVGVLLLTGVYSAVLHVENLNALLYTPYGQALLLKLLASAPMLALGGINFLFTTPVMRKAAAQPGGSPLLVNRFRGLLTGEALLGMLILIWVGVFTALPPARTITAPAGFSQTVQADDLSITLTIDPGRAGMNTFTAVITSGGQAVAGAQDVSLEFRSLSGMLPPSKAAMANQGNGKYSLQGGYLSMPDPWDIKVVVIRTGKYDAYADFKLDLTQTGGPAMP
jgi:copper transport protein